MNAINKCIGFTLLEIVATLSLIGVIGGLSGMLLTATVQRHTLETRIADQNQKLNAALLRIVKELRWADADTVTVQNGGRELVWTSLHPDPSTVGEQSLSWDGNAGSDLILNAQPLLDRVAIFDAPDTLASGFIEIQLQTTVAPNTHQVRVYLRPGD